MVLFCFPPPLQFNADLRLPLNGPSAYYKWGVRPSVVVAQSVSLSTREGRVLVAPRYFPCCGRRRRVGVEVGGRGMSSDFSLNTLPSPLDPNTQNS